MTINKLALVAAISSLLAACGGSGSGSDGPSSSSSSSSSVSSSSSSDSTSSSSASSSSSGPNEYDGDWASCERFDTPQGFVTLGEGISGGADMGSGNYEVGVSTGVQIQNALSSVEFSDRPLTLYVDDLITWENSNNSNINIQRDDVTLVGRSGNAGLEGVGLELGNGASNVIIRNLELRLVPQAHGEGDLINLDGRNGDVSNIWIDHNEMYNSRTAPTEAGCGMDENCHKDYYDELVSGRGAVKNVTISYNYLHDSWKTSLWGSSDSAEEDAGRTITFHHNYWHNNNSRMPLFRYGEAHVFNNYYHDVDGSAINSRMGAEIRVDGNVFENVNHPITSQFSEERGFWDVEDNIFENVTASGSCPTTGSECLGAHEESTTAYIPGYVYDIMPASEVRDYVVQYAGLGVIDDCLDLPNPGDTGEAPEFNTDPQDPPEAYSVYDGELAPDAPGSIALEQGGNGEFELSGDTDQDYFTVNGDGTLGLDTSANAGLTHQATIHGILPEGYPKYLTVLAGVSGFAEDARLLEIETAFSDEGVPGSRLKTILRNQDGHVGIQLEQADNGESPDNYGDGLDMTQFRVYQISVTMNSATRGNVRVFVEGNDQPVISLLDVEMRAASAEGDNFVRIGDGGGHPYKSTVDWVVWTTESDYLPSDLKGALPEGLGDITGYEAE